MSPRSAAEIALGVAGVYLVAISVPQLVASATASLLVNDRDTVIRWVGIIAPLVSGSVGLGLIMWRKSVSAHVAPDSDAQGPDGGVTSTQAAAISVIGVYFLASGVSGLMRELFRAFVPSSRFGAPLSIDTCSGPLAEALVGMALFFGARGIVNVWLAVRRAGRPTAT